ncbi:DUF1800 domain-containing protein [soil metagenome]
MLASIQEGGVSQASTGSPLTPAHTGAHPDDLALPAPDPLHTLLSRCSYGIRLADWNRALTIDYTGWLQEQLAYTLLDDSAVEFAIANNFPRVAMSAGELLADARANNSGQKAAPELRNATLYRQLASPRQLFETMVEFWGDHFNIATLASPESYYKNVDDRVVIRANALGKFPEMLHASARSLAMLYYLDNVSNRSTGPNENYARELMELHTLGVDGGYTEHDVSEVARCFTGWTVATVGTEPVFTFVSSRHDNAAKTVLGTVIPSGGGVADGNAVLDLLAAHPSTAAHLARKLCIRFIGDVPQQSAIDAVAATYTATGGDIAAMMTTLLGSTEFIASYDRKIRRPLDYLLATLRCSDAVVSGNFLASIVTRLNSLGQLPFRWPTPDGYHDAMDAWVNAGAMLSRWNWAFAVAENKATGIALDLSALAAGANTPTLLVDTLANRLLHRMLLAADRDSLVAFAANGGAVDRILTTTEQPTRTRELAGLLLSSVYLQYR